MAERLNNDFQFLDVARQDPEKKILMSANLSLWKFTNHLLLKLLQIRRIVVWAVVIRTVNGNAQYITIFQTG